MNLASYDGLTFRVISIIVSDDCIIEVAKVLHRLKIVDLEAHPHLPVSTLHPRSCLVFG